MREIRGRGGFSKEGEVEYSVMERQVETNRWFK